MNRRQRAGWVPVVRRNTVTALHAPWPPPEDLEPRSVAICRVRGRPAVVLGSTQPVDTLDTARCSAAGVDIVRRRSGGGAVLVAPAAQVWVELWIPRDDPLWDDDVISAASWLGNSWMEALMAMGAKDLSVHAGRTTSSPWSAQVCFAGVGPGEVVTAGAKLVGVAQRRTRHGARFHCLSPLAWDPSALLALLRLDEGVRAGGAVELAGAATGLRDALSVGAEVDADDLVAAVEKALMAALP